MTESEPYFRDFSIISEVNEGRFDRVTLTILRDEASSTAPLEKNDNVKALCVVEADLSHIPDSHIPQRQGNDGLMYYVVNCQIEISCKSNIEPKSLGDLECSEDLLTQKQQNNRLLGFYILHFVAQR